MKKKKIIFEHYLSKFESEISILSEDYPIINDSIQWLFNSASHDRIVKIALKIQSRLLTEGYWKFSKQFLKLAIDSANFQNDKNSIALLQARYSYLEVCSQSRTKDLQIVKDAISYFEDHFLFMNEDLDYCKKFDVHESLLRSYLHCKYLLAHETFDRKCFLQGLNISLQNSNIGLSHYAHLIAEHYKTIGRLNDAKILHNNMSGYWSEDNFYNEVLHKSLEIELINERNGYLASLKNFVSKYLPIALEKTEIHALISLILPAAINLKLYECDVESANQLLLEFEKYAGRFDSPSVWYKFLMLRAKIKRQNGNYEEYKNDILKAHNLSAISEVIIAYAYLLTDDYNETLRILDRYINNRDDNNPDDLISEILYHLLSIYISTKSGITGKNNHIEQLLSLINKVGYGRFALDYPLVEKVVSEYTYKQYKEKMIIDENKPSNPSFTLSDHYIWNCEPKFNENNLKLPIKMDNSLLTVSELFQIAKNNKIEIPDYYVINKECDPDLPVRFIPGRIVFKLIHSTGILIPNYSLLRSISIPKCNASYVDEIPSAENWQKIIVDVQEWLGFNSALSKKIIYLILWSKAFRIEEKALFLKKIKESNCNVLPRNIYYRLHGTTLKVSELEQDHNAAIRIRNHWRQCISVLAFLNIINMPEINSFFFVDDDQLFYPADKIYICNIDPEKYFCHTLSQRLETSNIDISYADCGVLKIPFVNK